MTCLPFPDHDIDAVALVAFAELWGIIMLSCLLFVILLADTFIHYLRYSLFDLDLLMVCSGMTHFSVTCFIAFFLFVYN